METVLRRAVGGHWAWGRIRAWVWGLNKCPWEAVRDCVLDEPFIIPSIISSAIQPSISKKVKLINDVREPDGVAKDCASSAIVLNDNGQEPVLTHIYARLASVGSGLRWSSTISCPLRLLLVPALCNRKITANLDRQLLFSYSASRNLV